MDEEIKKEINETLALFEKYELIGAKIKVATEKQYFRMDNLGRAVYKRGVDRRGTIYLSMRSLFANGEQNIGANVADYRLW